MKVNGINPNKVINMYGVKNSRALERKKDIDLSDKLEISDVGKSLSAYSIGNDIIPNDKKVREIKNKIASGKYSVTPEDLARSIMEAFERKEI
ncbi:flagellar biosynthesis anti-sigma factor FlgM [Clostridium sp. KNHs214]|uniref:flagellar biosynthesis anti-sigma factor FlgM n=1 Tax=Clostridium sp. KNHs214 TaxID=1540257 RepID=UPI0005536B5D|nr:flagellar biosynthesis anti-sigma factor FlgM [Clostridium sp. KNHs214]